MTSEGYKIIDSHEVRSTMSDLIAEIAGVLVRTHLRLALLCLLGLGS